VHAFQLTKVLMLVFLKYVLMDLTKRQQWPAYSAIQVVIFILEQKALHYHSLFHANCLIL